MANNISAISVSDSFFRTASFITTLNDNINTYTHTIDNFGGYVSASFSLSDSQENVEDWLSDGLGRHIEVYDEGQNKIWEGFVNQVDISLGSLSVKRGPLLDITNRVKVIFPIIVGLGFTPPIIGTATSTGIVDDTVSQGKYGIIYRVLDAGNSTVVNANELANSYLANFKEPETSHSVNIGGGGDAPTAKVDCIGYYNFLKYPYSVATIGEQNLSTKIQDIITAEPNSIISTDFTKITANTLQVTTQEVDDNEGLSLIKGLLSLGDTSDNRYLFGVFNDKVAKYNVVPTTLEYQQRLSDPEGKIETLTGERINPWNVMPGRWLLLNDFLIGKTIPTDLRLDQRAIFIERVTFTAPWGLTIEGGKSDTLPQKFAKLGLGGITV